MLQKRALPSREHVFIGSLLSQGFRLAKPSSYLKLSKGYIIPSSTREDAVGEDFFIKLPTEKSTIPIQITQSGIQIFKKFQKPEKSELEKFIAQSESRIRAKRWLCRRNGIIFVLVQDYLGETTNRDLAWSDLKALNIGYDLPNDLPHSNGFISIGPCHMCNLEKGCELLVNLQNNRFRTTYCRKKRDTLLTLVTLVRQETLQDSVNFIKKAMREAGF